MVETCRPDRPGGSFGLWPAFWQHDTTSESSAQDWIDSTLRFYETTGTALVKLTGPAHYQVADRGVEGSWQGAALGERTFTRRAVHELHDWTRVPDGFTDAEEFVVGVAAHLRRLLPVDTPLLVTVFLPATQAMMLAEPSLFIAHARTDPALLRAALDQLARQTITLMARFAEARVDGIFLVSKHHDPTQIDEAHYHTLIAESDQAVIAAARCFSANILHLHGQPVHLSGLPTDDHWMLHAGCGPGHRSLAELRTGTTLPLLIGLDHAAWERGAITAQLRENLRETRQRSALVGAPCAVPLRYARSDIAAWSRHVQEAHAELSAR